MKRKLTKDATIRVVDWVNRIESGKVTDKHLHNVITSIQNMPLLMFEYHYCELYTKSHKIEKIYFTLNDFE